MGPVEEMAGGRWSARACEEPKPGAPWPAPSEVLDVPRGVRHSPFCQGAHSLVGEPTSKQASQETCRIKQGEKG